MIGHIWQLHHRYATGVPSGENLTVNAIAERILESGYRVTQIQTETDSLSTTRLLSAGLAQIMNRSMLVPPTGSRPDLVQVHNTFPGFTPRDIDQLTSAGIPMVRVVHNYRISCLRGDHWLDGKSCFRCVVRRGFLPGVSRSCYRGSRVQSLVASRHTSQINALESVWSQYVAISDHMRQYLRSQGVAGERISVIDNSVPGREVIDADADGFLYCGRLDEGKGVRVLLDAWAGMSRSIGRLHIVGSGIESEHVRLRAQQLQNVSFHGALDPLALERVARRCRVAIVPGLWDEPFGRVAAEALSRGQLLIVSRTGALAEFVREKENGFVIQPGDPAALTAAIEAAEGLPRQASDLSLELWRSRYAPTIVAMEWAALYRRLLEE